MCMIVTVMAFERTVCRGPGAASLLELALMQAVVELDALVNKLVEHSAADCVNEEVLDTFLETFVEVITLRKVVEA